MQGHVYDNQYSPFNVYGHAVELIRQHGTKEGVHLDLGCSFGRMAETLREVPGLTYVGVDASEDGLSSLRERGFECWQHVLGDPKVDIPFLKSILAGRHLRSVSILDTLEHLPDPESVLRILYGLCREYECPLVVSVPNVTHRDVGFKAAFGLWDYTPAGLLDMTHLRFFSEKILSQMALGAGWLEVAKYDVELEKSDQHFPPEHLALAEKSALHGLLSSLRNRLPNARVNQFVRAYLPTELSDCSWVVPHAQAPRPFLSVVTRTQGKRIETLREVFLSLAAQTCDDFEVVVVGHCLTSQARDTIVSEISELPTAVASRIRLVELDHGNRTAPLNLGFQEARGQYISILDDDDIPFAHWVEEFKRLATAHPGKMLRTVAVRQEFDRVETLSGASSVRAASGMLRDYPAEFDLFRQLCTNLTPNTALAFPRSVFHDFGLQFDESLTTTEDWDFLMRVAFICDVASSDEITCIYRWWKNSESSRTEHDEVEWTRNFDRISQKMNSEYLILPPGSALKIRDLVMIQARHVAPESAQSISMTHLELMSALKSPSWMVTQPIRWVGHLLGNPTPVQPRNIPSMTEGEAQETLQAVRTSRSMRLASVLGRTKNWLLRKT